MPAALVAHPSADVYGSDLQLCESIAGLRADGWDVTVCLPSTGPLVDRLIGVDVLVTPFAVLRKALLSPIGIGRLAVGVLREVARLVGIIRRTRPDVLYVNTVTIPWWIVAGRLTGTPVVVHVHEAEDEVARPIRVALAAPMLLARRIIANSASSASALHSAVPALAGRTVVVPNGLDDPGPASVAAAEPGRLALVARLSPRKGIDVALDAVGQLRAEGREVRLDLAGTAYSGYEWYERELRERAARPDLAGAVTFHGYVHPSAGVLASAQIVLVPSRIEPFGNTAVEALLSQRPLVASRVQGLAEIVDDGRTGLLVPPGDVGALAAALRRLLDDAELRDRLAAAGRADATQRFGAPRYRAEIARQVASLVR